VFRAKRADRIKLVWWDGSGLCLFVKRLEQGRFRWPRIEDGTVHLTAAQLAALIQGMEWTRARWSRLCRRQRNSCSITTQRAERRAAGFWVGPDTRHTGRVTLETENLPSDPEELRALLLAERATHTAELARARDQNERLRQIIREL